MLPNTNSLSSQPLYLCMRGKEWELPVAVNLEEHQELLEAAMKIESSSQNSISDRSIAVISQDQEGRVHILTSEELKKGALDVTSNPLQVQIEQVYQRIFAPQNEEISPVYEADSLQELIRSGVSLDQLLAIEDQDLRLEIIKQGYGIKKILRNANISFKQFMEVEDKKHLFYIVSESSKIATLFENGVSWEQLIAIPEEYLKKILYLKYEIQHLLNSKKVTFSEITENPDFFNDIFNFRWVGRITHLLKNSSLSFEQLLMLANKMTPMEFVYHENDVSQLLSQVSYEQLMKVEEPELFQTIIVTSSDLFKLLSDQDLSLTTILAIENKDLLFKVIQHSADISDLLTATKRSFPQLMEVQNQKRLLEIIDQSSSTLHLVKNGLSLNQLLEIQNDSLFYMIINNSGSIGDLLNTKKISFDQLIESKNRNFIEGITKSHYNAYAVTKLLENSIISFDQLTALVEKVTLDSFFLHSGNISSLLSKISFKQLMEIQDKELFNKILSKGHSLSELLSSPDIFDQLIAIEDRTLLNTIIENASDTSKLLEDSKMSFSELLRVPDKDLLPQIISNSGRFIPLFKIGVSVEQLTSIKDPELLSLIANRARSLAELLKTKSAFDQFINIQDNTLRNSILQKAEGITGMLNENEKSFDWLLGIQDQDLLLLLVTNSYSVEELLKAGVHIDQLLEIPNEQLIMIIRGAYNVKDLLLAGISLNQLIAPQYKTLFPTVIDTPITSLLTVNPLSLDQLISLNSKIPFDDHFFAQVPGFSKLLSKITFDQFMEIKDKKLFEEVLKNSSALADLLSYSDLSFDQLMDFEDKEKLLQIIKSSREVISLLKTKVPLSQLMILKEFSQLLANERGVLNLLTTAQISLNTLLSINDIRFITKADNISKLIENSALSFDELLAHKEKGFLLSKAFEISQLLPAAKISLNELLMHKERELLLSNAFEISQLLPAAKISLNELLMHKERELLISNAFDISRLLLAAKISLNELLMHKEREILLSNARDISCLLHDTGCSLSKLLEIQDENLNHLLLMNASTISRLLSTSKTSLDQLITLRNKDIILPTIYHSFRLAIWLHNNSLSFTEWLKRDLPILKEDLHKIQSHELVKIFQEKISNPIFNSESDRILNGYPQAKAILHLYADSQRSPLERLREMIQMSNNPQRYENLILELDKQPLHAQERSLKWITLYLSFAVTFSRDDEALHQDLKSKQILRTLFDYKNPATSIATVPMLFDYYHQKLRLDPVQVDPWDALWQSKSAQTYKSDEYQLLIFLFIALFRKDEEKIDSTENLMNKILTLKMVQDFNTRNILISSLQLLIQEPLLPSEKKKDLLKIVFSAKTHAEIKTALTDMKNLLLLGYGGKLLDIKSSEEISIQLQGIFQTEFKIPTTPEFSSQYETVFGKFRNIQALFTYLGTLKTDSTYQQEALGLLSSYVQSLLEGTFKTERYDTEKNLHLKTLFENNKSLQEEWTKGSPPIEVKPLLSTIRSKSNGIPPGKEMKEFFKQSIIVDQHLKEFDKNYPTLAAYLSESPPLAFDQALQEVNEKLKTNSNDKNLIVEQQALLLMDPKNNGENHLSLLKSLKEHLPEGEELRNDINSKITQRSNLLSMENLVISDTDDPEDLLLIGTEVSGSCQRVDGDSSLNIGLLGYIHNGQTRAIVIKDKRSGSIVCRSLIRLLLNKENKPVLFLERFYTNTSAPELELLVKEMALRRAKALDIPLLSAKGTNAPYSQPIRSLGGRSLFEYVDGAAGGGVQRGPYTISNSYEIKE